MTGGGGATVAAGGSVCSRPTRLATRAMSEAPSVDQPRWPNCCRRERASSCSGDCSRVESSCRTMTAADMPCSSDNDFSLSGLPSVVRAASGVCAAWSGPSCPARRSAGRIRGKRRERPPLSRAKDIPGSQGWPSPSGSIVWMLSWGMRGPVEEQRRRLHPGSAWMRSCAMTSSAAVMHAFFTRVALREGGEVETLRGPSGRCSRWHVSCVGSSVHRQ
ncbi:hypothetical protein WA016_04341 [Myxococcus stipitatus]